MTSLDELNDIIDTIKYFIEKVKQVEQVANQISKIVNDIKKKINMIFCKIPEIIDEIKQKIDEFIAFDEAGRKCTEAACLDIEAACLDIKALVQDVKVGVQVCVPAAKAQANSLRLLAENLVREATNLREDIQNRLAKCLEDNQMNPFGFFICLKNQVKIIQQAVEDLEALIKATINTATQIGQETVVDLGKFGAAVQQDSLQTKQAIVESIEKCIQENTQA